MSYTDPSPLAPRRGSYFFLDRGKWSFSMAFKTKTKGFKIQDAAAAHASMGALTTERHEVMINSKSQWFYTLLVVVSWVQLQEET